MGSSPIRPVYNGSQVSLRSIYDQEKEENVEQKGSRRNSRIDSSFGPQREPEVRYVSRGCSPIDFDEMNDSDNDSPKRRKSTDTSYYRDKSDDYGAPPKGRELPSTPPAERNGGFSRQSERNRSFSRQSEENNSPNNDYGDENEIPTGREIQNTPPSERNSRRFFKDVEDPKNEDQDRKSTSGSQGTSTAESSSSKRWGGKADKKDYESSSLPDSVQGSGKYSRYLQEEKKTKRSSRSSSQNQLSKPSEENALMRRKSYDASVR
ncbi:uncharacterized protein LOC111717976 [Eurytemora carolleeae]|uniref:uncharacterized protein LOC111717976 n=1 Tax=Eurytemora carolleeae TaxID=1294199 RepID=UPI000C77E981|nr:uncharacterized protein LOC111717976 [Eurytemora carolleeae]|eukprot:XP_023349211.1 uncharacterized protein LOC111717976 [Eurytemora affinis]